MNELKEKFLNELREKLIEAEVSEYQAVIDKYSLAYEDNLAVGMTDIECMVQLGDPADIVYSLLNNNKTNLKNTINELINNNLETTNAHMTNRADDKLRQRVKPLKVFYFIAVMLTALLIPISIVYAGLSLILYEELPKMLLYGSFSLIVGLLMIVLNIYLRTRVKVMLIKLSEIN